MLSKLMARNLRRPEGFFGTLVGSQMNRVNRRMSRAAVALLCASPDERILEIGFGGGASLVPIARCLRSGCIVGVDFSDTMHEQLARRHGKLIRSGRVSLLKGEAEDLPCEDASFDRALTLNTLYFWSDPARVAGEVLRVLRPGGVFVLGFRPKDAMLRLPFTRHGFTMYADEEVYSLLQRAGFGSIRFERGDDDSMGYVCAVARKPD